MVGRKSRAKVNETQNRVVWQTLKKRLRHPAEAIKGYYGAALRHNQGDPSLIAEYGAFLVVAGFAADATEIFEKGKQLRVSAAEKNSSRQWWTDDDGKKIVFSGRVDEIRGGVGIVIAVPDNFKALYWRTKSGRVADLVKGDTVTFTIAFTAQGPRAELR